MINDFAQSLNIPNLYLSHIFYCCLLQHTRTNFFIFQIYWDRSWLRHISADRKRTDRVQWAVHTTKWLPLLRRDWWAVLQFRVFFCCCCCCTFVRSATLFKFHAYVHKRKRIKNGSNLLFLLYLLFVYCLELIVVFAKGSRARHTKKCLSNTKAWKKIPNKINKIAGKWQWLDQRHSFSPINIYIYRWNANFFPFDRFVVVGIGKSLPRQNGPSKVSAAHSFFYFLRLPLSHLYRREIYEFHTSHSIYMVCLFVSQWPLIRRMDFSLFNLGLTAL